MPSLPKFLSVLKYGTLALSVTYFVGIMSIFENVPNSVYQSITKAEVYTKCKKSAVFGTMPSSSKDILIYFWPLPNGCNAALGSVNGKAASFKTNLCIPGDRRQNAPRAKCSTQT